MCSMEMNKGNALTVSHETDNESSFIYEMQSLHVSLDK
jgi:hypothetical protein